MWQGIQTVIDYRRKNLPWDQVLIVIIGDVRKTLLRVNPHEARPEISCLMSSQLNELLADVWISWMGCLTSTIHVAVFTDIFRSVK